MKKIIVKDYIDADRLMKEGKIEEYQIIHQQKQKLEEEHIMHI